MISIGKINLGEFPLLLAPMEDVSDPPFRAACKEFGADLMFTEFISSEGLIRDAEKSVQKLDIYEEEKPIGIQIFGSEYEPMMQSAEIVENTKPDVLDINFGCPVKKVVCKNSGAGILKDIPKMISLTKAVVRSTSLPVTVKTRLGWDENSIRIVEVAEKLQDVGIKAISIHGRTRKQMYRGEADWEWIARVKENPRINIPVFGNGDIDSPQRALQYKNEYGVDGLMIGRASIGNPWIFREIKQYLQNGIIVDPPTVEERVWVCKKHFERSVEWKGKHLGIVEMRRHYGNYFKGFGNIKPFRMKLVTSNCADEIRDTLSEIKYHYDRFPELIRA